MTPKSSSPAIVRVTLHDYVTDPALPQKDGVNLAHENIASLLKNQDRDNLAVEFHDFGRLMADEGYARRVLNDVDCVVSNVGAHAHYYFYLRERFGLDFRIIRDVRTALWSPYLLQEYLCQPYLRPRDVLLVASHYARAVYESVFPHLRHFSIARCYPLSVSFPPERPRKRCTLETVFTLGYLGRLSEDKNFPDIVDLLIELNRRQPGRFRLLACGDIHSPSCDPAKVEGYIREALGAGGYFEYLPARANGDIWDVYRQFDAMIFPSTSNLETLGRVLVEASYAGIPVVCGRHAAAPELMPASALSEVEYLAGQAFNTHQDHPLGRIDINDVADILSSGDLEPSVCYLDFLEHPRRFIDLLSGDADQLSEESALIKPHRVPRDFVESLKVQMPAPLDLLGADTLIHRLLPWFNALQMKGSKVREKRLQQLRGLSQFPLRTERFIDKSARTNCDFTDVGGIDMELCHIAGFYPQFVIRDERSAGRARVLEAGCSG